MITLVYFSAVLGPERGACRFLTLDDNFILWVVRPIPVPAFRVAAPLEKWHGSEEGYSVEWSSEPNIAVIWFVIVDCFYPADFRR
jgi:hypothetical protein